MAKPGGAKARRTSAGGSAGGAARGGKQQSGSDSGTQGTTTQPANAQQQLDGPSASRKAADHRRLLKSYMKALFRHLKLPVEYKSAPSATYRDRINNALAYWFGDSFAPGKTTRECHAPKVVCCLVRIATSGRVVIRPEDVSEILVKGLQAKNANYAVSAAALRKHKIADAELRAMFDGETRTMDGWPRGLPLNLPDRDEALPDFDSKAAKVAAALSPVKEEPNPAEADEGGGEIEGAIKPGAAVKGARSKRGGGAKRPDVTRTPLPRRRGSRRRDSRRRLAAVLAGGPRRRRVRRRGAHARTLGTERSGAGVHAVRGGPAHRQREGAGGPGYSDGDDKLRAGRAGSAGDGDGEGATRGVARGVGGGRGGPAVLASGRGEPVAAE